MNDDFDNLLTTDTEWCRNFAAALQILDDYTTGQLALLPVDDFIAHKRYMPCPRRGTYQKLTACRAR